MSVHLSTFLAILLMGVATYSTRLIGYALLGNRELSPRAKRVMDAAPGCVLISVIAPHFVSGGPADLMALIVTAVAATRLSLLPTILIGVTSAGLLRLL